MAQEIEMYNAYFGDCFILKDINSNLLVDFGIHNCAQVYNCTYTNRQKLIESIADDIRKRYEKLSVLITHFHNDHICGLIYMYKSGLGKFSGLFNKIYIPDVWGNPFTVVTSLLEEMVLRVQLKKTGLPGTIASLFDLIEFICNSARNVILLSRGITFENDKYLTLWPPKKTCKAVYAAILAEMDIPDGLIGDLYELSQNICDHVQNVLGNGEIVENNNLERIQDFRRNYENLIAQYESQMENFVSFEQLNKLGHKINVVFHNDVCGDENVLFTGDAEISHMDYIVFAPDYKMHPKYKFIKVPHHGTPKHYYDFTLFQPEHILIPNGAVNGHVHKAAYMIDLRYGNLTARHTCSNSNNCSGRTNGCSLKTSCKCSTKDIIFPFLYKTIR